MLCGVFARRSMLGLALLVCGACLPEESGEDPDDDAPPDDDDDEAPPDDDVDEIPSATGRWTGGVVGLTFELIVLELDGGGLSGTGTVRGANGTAYLTIDSGRHRHPDIGMTLAAPGIEPLVLAGKFENDDEIRGKASGSGLSAAPFTLVRG